MQPGFFERALQRTPMRPLLARTYAVVLGMAFILVGVAVGGLVYMYLLSSAAGILAMHVEAAWYQAVPSARPGYDDDHPGPRPPFDEGHHPHHHRFVLEAPLDVASLAPTVVANVASHPFFAARVVDLSGRVLASSRHADLLPSLSAAEVARQAEESDRSMFPKGHLIEGLRGPWQTITMPLMHDGHVIGLLQAGISFGMQMRLITQLALALLVSAVLAIALGIGAASMLSRVIVRPLERLAVVARRFAAGELGARTHLPRGQNEVMAVAASFDDMAAQLQASFAAQRRFVADASHELKTPLTAIGGMVDLMEVGADVNPQRRETIVKTMAIEVERMGALVADLLTLSRAERRSQQPEKVDVAALLSDLVDEVRMRHSAHPIDSDLRGPLWTMAEPDALRRAVSNLVDNALAYSSAGRPVVLAAQRAPDGSIAVSVRDQGIGIAAEDLPHVFDRFYRADRSRARSTGGSGLGLSIVRAIIESSGGSVTLESADGQGTVARITLPSAG